MLKSGYQKLPFRDRPLILRLDAPLGTCTPRGTFAYRQGTFIVHLQQI